MNNSTPLSQQNVQRFDHPGGQQPPADPEAGAQPLDLEVHNHIRDWVKIMVTFCLALGPAIALTYAQIYSKFSPTFHVLSFESLLCIASFFISKFMKAKFPVRARVLDFVGVFFGVTAYFTVITISFPLYLQLIAWLVYAISIVAALYTILFQVEFEFKFSPFSYKIEI
jgi:hypothetical protein